MQLAENEKFPIWLDWETFSFQIEAIFIIDCNIQGLEEFRL